jgi:hypothetical protein
MRDIPVTFDEHRGGYVAERAGAPPVRALSLTHLRRRVEDAEGVEVRLVLDRKARLERDARRRAGVTRAGESRLR